MFAESAVSRTWSLKAIVISVLDAVVRYCSGTLESKSKLKQLVI